MRLVLCVALALTFTPAMGSAQDLDAGIAAYEAGDYVTALREWRPLADLGDAAAQYRLGLMYHVGGDVPRDYSKVLAWYQKAAEQGFAAAQTNLGGMYYFGNGVPQDYAKAEALYLKAAEQGDAGAQHGLGGMYAEGKGVPQDYLSAHMWYNLASGNGFADGPAAREALAVKMTPEDVSEAQRRARVCLESNYQDCG